MMCLKANFVNSFCIIYILFICIVFCRAGTESYEGKTAVTENPGAEVKCNTSQPEESFGYFQSTNFPDFYPLENTCLDVTVDETSNIRLTMEAFDINSANNDYVLIQPGTEMEERRGSMFVWNVNQTKYIIPSQFVHLEFHSFKASEKYTGFKIKWEKYGNVTITTEAPSTTESYPNPGPDDVYVVHLAVPPAQFAQSVATFSELLAEKAQIFCDDPANHIKLRENITSANVQIIVAIVCPYGWPRRESCTEVTFAIPVLLTKIGEYQLTGTNLARIWASITDEELPIPLVRYTKPTASSTLTTWVTVFLVFTGGFIIFLIIVQQCGHRLDSRRKRRQSGLINLTPQKRDSDVNQWPRQSVPKFIDDFEYTSGYTNASFNDDDENELFSANIITPHRTSETAV